MNLFVIFNKFAAGGKSHKFRVILEKKLNEAGISYDIISTDSAQYAREQAAEADFEKYDAIAAAGGDGTVFHTLNGYVENISPVKIPFAVIPMGTGNAFARDLALPSNDIGTAVEAIKSRKTITADIGKFITGGIEYYFANIIGLGFVTDVARTAHKLKFLGKLSYTLGVLYHTIFLKPFKTRIEYDGKTIEREVVFIEISNTRYTGRDFIMAPSAIINDGLLDITILNKASRFTVLKGLPKIFSGSHIHMPEVESIQAQLIKISTDSPKVLTPDGEILGSTPIEIECLHKKIEVFAKTEF